MTKQENKELIGKYPFLQPRNVWTGKVPEDYDYSYIRGISELPNGWHKLFLQMCKDIRQSLIETNTLETFNFSQIKEKYGRMTCYTFGISEKTHDIILKYEHISRYVCLYCGKPAVYITQGWIMPVCEECWKDKTRFQEVDNIEFKPQYTKISYGTDIGYEEKTISFEEEWIRYLKEIE